MQSAWRVCVCVTRLWDAITQDRKVAVEWKLACRSAILRRWTLLFLVPVKVTWGQILAKNPKHWNSNNFQWQCPTHFMFWDKMWIGKRKFFKQNGHVIRGHLGVKKYIFLHKTRTKGQFELGTTFGWSLSHFDPWPQFDLFDLWQ